MTFPDYILAHRHSSDHREEIMSGSLCGCYYCLALFPPSEIQEWVDESVVDEIGQTAVCPKCGIPSVIGNKSTYPITEEFLRTMQHRWFGPEYDTILPSK